MKIIAVLVLVTATLLFSGCGVLCKPTYTPTGNLAFQDLSGMPVKLQVEDPRKKDQKAFFRFMLLGGHTDYFEERKDDYVRLQTTSREIIEQSLKKALDTAGYQIAEDAPITINVTLLKFLAVSPDTWDSQPDVITADIEVEVEIKKVGAKFLRKRIAQHTTKQWNAFHQYEDSQVVLSWCLSNIVEKLASDNSILDAVKRAYGIEVPDKTAKRDEGKQPAESDYPQKQMPPSQGTGFLLSESGLVATNYHVVAGHSNICVIFPNQNITFDAEVQLKDINNDLAILRLKDFTYGKVSSGKIPYAIKRSDSVKLGEKVFTLGFPFGEVLGKSTKFSTGTISSLYGLFDNASLFQISNPIQPGNSGGPLFDQNGNLVGIVIASLNAKLFYEELDTIPQNVNFGIKSDYLINLISMVPERDEILRRTGSLASKGLEEQVEALVPYVVPVYGK